MTDNAASPVKRFIGQALIAIGVLWIAASGLCSGWMLLWTVASGGDWREALSIVPMILIVGGFSVGIGFVFYVIGRALRPKA